MKKNYLKSGSRVTWHRDTLGVERGKFATEPVRVKIMAMADGFAMVKESGRNPFAVPIASLTSR